MNMETRPGIEEIELFDTSNTTLAGLSQAEISIWRCCERRESPASWVHLQSGRDLTHLRTPLHLHPYQRLTCPHLKRFCTVMASKFQCFAIQIE
ncbi:hypothetical protein E2C01_041961 [Portunus trituberculatus]|uniref:Uncharacterized protein n=1 Tax=Portunus trituberculatus TaxID=210409 RepID=A0A5B7FT32_PORTR|nr:hypothetical protein [Portunus trituberculatus]